MPTTTLMPLPKQQFLANTGAPLAGGKVYTFAAGTSTPKDTFTDPEGTVKQQNPIPLNARGEPQSPIYWSGNYRVEVRSAVGITIYVVDNFNTDPGGVWGSAANALATLAANAGSALVGFIQSAAGAIKRTVQDKLTDTVSIKDFGATTSSPDITAAINAAIKHCVTAGGGGEIDFPYFGTFNVLGTVLLPSHIKLNLRRCTLVGNGNTMFETAYVNGSGNIVSNIGQPAETKLVTNCEIEGGKIQKAGIAFNLYNFIEGCSVISTRFEGCTKAIYADRCFYASFKRLMARRWFDGEVTDAFTFINFTNVIAIESVAAVGYDRGIVIAGGADGQKLLNCTGEGGRIGAAVVSETSTLEFDTCYFEGNTECGLDLQTAGNKKITVRNTWFFSMPIGIRGGAGTTCDIDQSNTFKSTPVKYQVNDLNSDFTRFVEPPTSLSSGTLAPADGITLDRRGHYESEVTYFDPASGNANAKTISRNGGYIPMECSGTAGYAGSRVPFCTVTKKDGTTVSILTSIVDSDMQIIAYNLTVGDNNNEYNLYGFIFGRQVHQLDSEARTVTATTSGDKLVIEVGSLSIPGPVAACSGVVRHA